MDKSLIRFTCVSKRWRAIILHDPKFSKSQLQLASQHKTLRQRFLISNYPTLQTLAHISDPRFRPRFQSLEDNFSIQNLNFGCEENSNIVIMGSCNGLVLLGKCYWTHYENLAIWNPSTGYFRSIPSPSFRIGKKRSNERNEECLFFINYGFGHVSATDDYKLVFILVAFGGLVEVHVFSLRADVWRVEGLYLSWPGLIGGRGTLSNGALHWIIHSRNEVSSFIYAFDLAEEEFRQVALPVSIQDQKVLRTLVLSNGCLCVWFGERDWHSEFWALIEYAVTKSWVKLFQFSVNGLPDVFALCSMWDPIFVTEGGTVVIKLLDKEELVKIECRKEEKPFCSGRYRLEEVPGCKLHFVAAVYDETLVSVPF